MKFRGSATRGTLSKGRIVEMPRLFRTDIAADADIRVFVTDVRSDADLVCFVTTDAWEAGKSTVWFYADIAGDAEKAVCFVENRFDADLVVFFTDVQPDGEWLVPEKSGLL